MPTTTYTPEEIARRTAIIQGYGNLPNIGGLIVNNDIAAMTSGLNTNPQAGLNGEYYPVGTEAELVNYLDKRVAALGGSNMMIAGKNPYLDMKQQLGLTPAPVAAPTPAPFVPATPGAVEPSRVSLPYSSTQNLNQPPPAEAPAPTPAAPAAAVQPAVQPAAPLASVVAAAPNYQPASGGPATYVPPTPTPTPAPAPQPTAAAKTTSLVDIWASRPDLQKVFPQGTVAGSADNANLNNWWNASGVKEYPGVTLVAPGTAGITPPAQLTLEAQQGKSPVPSAYQPAGQAPGTPATQPAPQPTAATGGTAPSGGRAPATPAPQTPNPQAAVDAINALANQTQGKGASAIDEAGLDYGDSINTLLTEATKLLTGAEKPAQQTRVENYTAQRAALGIGAIEDQYAAAQNEVAALDAQYQNELEAEGIEVKSMREIQRGQSKIELEYNTRRRELENKQTRLANQLNMKYGVLNTMVTLTGQDMDSARAEYNNRFSQIVSLTQLLTGVQASAKSDLEKSKDNARANLQIVQNLLTSGSLTYAQLPESARTDIRNMEISAGLPQGFLSFVTQTVKDPIQHFTEYTAADGTKKVSLITRGKDGQLTTTTVSLGAVKDTGTDKPPTEAGYAETVQKVVKGLEATKGGDGKYDPDKYAAARAAILADNPKFDIAQLDAAVKDKFSADAIARLRSQYGIALPEPKDGVIRF